MLAGDMFNVWNVEKHGQWQYWMVWERWLGGNLEISCDTEPVLALESSSFPKK